MDKLYTVQAAAERLGGVSQWAIWKWIQQGRLARTRVGRRVMVSELSIQRFLLECAKRSK
jgi:excisionase family DNA binding protein